MKYVTLEVKDNKFRFFLELVRSFDFIKVKETKTFTSEKEATLFQIANGMREAKLASKGKIKSRPAKDFLNEL